MCSVFFCRFCRTSQKRPTADAGTQERNMLVNYNPHEYTSAHDYTYDEIGDQLSGNRDSATLPDSNGVACCRQEQLSGGACVGHRGGHQSSDGFNLSHQTSLPSIDSYVRRSSYISPVPDGNVDQLF